MVVVPRKVNEQIWCGDVRIVLKHIDGDEAKIGVDAPRGTPVYRAGLCSAVKPRALPLLLMDFAEWLYEAKMTEATAELLIDTIRAQYVRRTDVA